MNQALKDTATIPSDQCFPSNSFTYITANAILGNTLLLEDIALLIQNDEKRAIATYVKTEHVKNALNYCKSDQRADLQKYLKL